MSNPSVFFDGADPETAQTLLDAAADSGLDASVVVASRGGLMVPVEVAFAAGLIEAPKRARRKKSSSDLPDPVELDTDAS